MTVSAPRGAPGAALGRVLLEAILPESRASGRDGSCTSATASPTFPAAAASTVSSRRCSTTRDRGCAAAAYCPADAVRASRCPYSCWSSKEGAGYRPPACTTPVFARRAGGQPVLPVHRRAGAARRGGRLRRWQLLPGRPRVARADGGVRVAHARSGAEPAGVHDPRVCRRAGDSPFCRWIEELARRGIVTGCGGGNYCPPSPVTREQMAVFMGVTFGLTLHGP